jgi:class 3 adenylate cyclase/tetratricopeptide (TPR) repeat protein
MACPQCHAQNPDDASFCQECGSRLEPACPSCGEFNRFGAKFCKKCGARLAPANALGAAPTSNFGAPDSYTPKHLAEKILTSRTALEGERKQVTILIADLKGSMELLSEHDPEEAHNLLVSVLERMMDAVHRYEGTVSEVRGDGIMALFGAPVAHEDHALRACYAALDMQAAIYHYAEELRRSHGVKAQIRVGLNSGEVVVRAIGSDLRMDYAAVGQSAHLAGRMEQLADPGTTLLTAHTLRLAEGYIEVRPLGPVPVKGLDDPIEVYELSGAGTARSRLHAAAARGLSRFVGRNDELEQLRRALEKAAAGHGQVVAIVGEAGVGKSRLVWEVMHSHRTQGWLIAPASSVSYGKATPYLPISDLLREYFQIEARDDHRKVREKVSGKLFTLDRALEPTLPALLSLVDVPVEDSSWQALDPRQRRQQTLDAVKQLLLRNTLVQPVLVVFEDLHWVDSETQALLDNLVESMPTARLLLLVNYRPEYAQRWDSKSYFTQLRLEPLPPESADELLNGLLGDDLSLQPLRRVLIERTQGNPFFLEESVLTLLETEVLAGKRGSYRLARPVDAIRVPSTVQAMLAARIDRLPPEEKQLLETAAVIGKDVPFALLRAISGLAEDRLRLALAHLQVAEFLYETSLFPQLEHTFKHALTHEVVYGTLLKEQRRALHGRIVAAMEQLYADRLLEYVGRLAHHAVRGELWEKALTYHRQAGTKAMGRSAYVEAVHYFEQALDASRHLSQDRSLVEQTIDLRCELPGALLALELFQPMREHLEEAYALAQTLDDQRRLGRIDAYRTVCFRSMGDHARAIECGLRSLRSATTLKDFALQVAVNCYLGEAYATISDYPRAVQHLTWIIDHVQGDLIQERFGMMIGLPSALARARLARALADQGEFEVGRARGAEGLAIAEASEQPLSLAACLWALGYLHLQQGEIASATSLLERGVRLAEQRDIPNWLNGLRPMLGYAYALAGRLDDAIPLLVEANRRLGATRGGHALYRAQLGEVYLWAGRTDDALKLATDALDTARRHGERGYEAVARRALGEIAARADPADIDTATDHYEDAIVLSEELGMRPLIAHCHLSLGRLYAETPERQKAVQYLNSAAKLFRKMDMRFWLPQLEGLLANVH